tara:strand:- start:852 stop:1703 length:852 start_codon:yes stop_codon:yes gene_type:complete
MMIRIRIFTLITFISIILNSCAVPIIAYHPKENQNDVETRYVDGNKLATSTKPNSSLSVVSIKKFEYGGGVNKIKYLVVDVVLKNNSERESNFLPENVQVMAFNAENRMKALKTYRPNEFLGKMKKIQRIANAAQAMGNAMDNVNAGKTTSTTTSSSSSNITGSSNTTGSFSTNTGLYGSGQSQTQLTGNVNTSASSNTTTIDHDAKRRAEKESAQELMKIREMQNSQSREMESLLLKANTLSPGQVVGGKLVIEYSSSYNQSLQLKIPFSSDSHEIQYSLVK